MHSSSIAELARRCAEEMARYQRERHGDSSSCFELFRRALEQGDDEAWASIYSQYHRLVRGWLGKALGKSDFLVNRVFERFWRATSPQGLARFASLGSILEYLKRCAISEAGDEGRRLKRRQQEEQALHHVHAVMCQLGTEFSPEQVVDRVAQEELFTCVTQALHSVEERLVFRAMFEWGLKPRMLVERWPDTFESPPQVSRIKARILRRLARDKVLRDLLGWGGQNGDIGVD